MHITVLYVEIWINRNITLLSLLFAADYLSILHNMHGWMGAAELGGGSNPVVYFQNVMKRGGQKVVRHQR